MVKFALWALRIYLLVLLSLIGFKFARSFSASKADAKPAETSSPAQPKPPGASR
jgi:hypothetical protein